MTTMRAMHAGTAPARPNGRVGLWLGALALGVALLYVPFAAGGVGVMRWIWPVAAVLLFLGVRGLGAAAQEEFGDRERTPREDAVGAWLNRLGGKAHVLRYVAAGGRSIEYVVVAQSGVFAIRTRTHRGKVAVSGGELTLNGRPLPPEVLGSARGEGAALEERLAGLGFSHAVRPLVVFTEARCDVRSVGDVTTLPLRWLESYIRTAPSVMSPLETTLVASALKHDARATSSR